MDYGLALIDLLHVKQQIDQFSICYVRFRSRLQNTFSYTQRHLLPQRRET